MRAVDQQARLRDLIAAPEILIVPGVYDAFSAFRAQEAGFQAVFVSGSALSAMHLARPDIGLLTLTETADIVGRIAERLAIPLFVDADQGSGNALTVARAIHLLERAGASGIQIEDQMETKPAAAPLSRPLVDPDVMVGKIKAALDSRRNEATVISARSDAVTTEGFDRALERAHLYADAGADMVFVESLTTRAEMARLVAELGPRAALLHNFLRAKDEVHDALTAERIGYSVALFPGAAVAAVGQALDTVFSDLIAAPKISADSAAPDRVGSRDYFVDLR
jgi:2-methylisocitrate lyase-like PEP mutase family enzyme